MCGITGLVLGDPNATWVAAELYEAFFYVQHRGQDAAGISTFHNGRVYHCKDNGMAHEVFSRFEDGEALMQNLPGWMGVSHVRYPTAGSLSALEAQPFYVNSPFGLSLAMNGNLVNTESLHNLLNVESRRHVNSDSDSELLLNIFAYYLDQVSVCQLNVEDVFMALRQVYQNCNGGFACTAMVGGFGVLAFRDANGIRPLCLGSRPSDTLKGAKDYFFASESIALKKLGFTDIVDVLPGQAVFIQKGGIGHTCQVVQPLSYTPDCFEWVYFSRQDSIMDGISVHRSRDNMGTRLGKKLRRTLSRAELENIDVVIPVPETSNVAAAALAQCLGKSFSPAFVKSRYVHRTFILPGQKQRKKSVVRKFSPIEREFRGKSVCIVDDSIVRGTTSREIVQMARDAGAVHVCFVSCSPEIRNPHIYGIDLPDPAELVAYGRSTEEIARFIKADRLVFQDLDDLEAACMDAVEGPKKIQGFEMGVFTGQYVTKVPERYLQNLIGLRGKRGTDHSIAVAKPIANVAGPMNGLEKGGKGVMMQGHQTGFSPVNIAVQH